MSPLAIPVANLGSGLVLWWDPADPFHIYVQGETRSGKSLFTYVYLSGLAQLSPVVQVWGADPTGILLDPWRDHPALEMRVASLDDFDQVVDTFVRWEDEMKRRIRLLKEYRLDKLPTDPNNPYYEPIAVVVLEEWPGLVAAAESDDAASGRKKADAVNTTIKRIHGRLVRESAKVNIRLFTLAQRMSSEAMATDDRMNYMCRASLKVDRLEDLRMVVPDATTDMSSRAAKFPPGRMYIVDPRLPDRIEMAQGHFIDYRNYVAPDGQPRLGYVERVEAAAPKPVPYSQTNKIDPYYSGDDPTTETRMN